MDDFGDCVCEFRLVEEVRRKTLLVKMALFNGGGKYMLTAGVFRGILTADTDEEDRG